MIKYIKYNHPYFILLPTFILGLVFIIKNYSSPIGDFGNYYYASKFLMNGDWGLWIYDVASFNLKIFELGQRDFYLNYTPVPPFSSILYIPFTFFNIGTAKLIWNLLNLILLLFTMYRFRNRVNINSVFWLLFPILFFTPFRNNINEGQSYFLLLFLIGEGFLQFEKGNLWMMAILWALAIHFKISPAFVFLFLAFNKNSKAIFYLSIISLLYFLVSLPFVTIPVWLNYIQDVLPRLFNGEINDTYALSYQSMQVLLKTVFVPDVLSNNNAWFDSPMIYTKLLLIFKVSLFILSILCANSKISLPIKFSVWLIFSLLISGYGNSFSLILLILPTLYFFNTTNQLLPIHYLYLVCLILTINVPFYWFSDLFLPFRFPRLYTYLGLFLILVFVSKITFKWYYLVFLFLIILIPFKTQKFYQNYLFKNEEEFLIYDFQLSGRQVLINYFDFNGPSAKIVPIDFKAKKKVYFNFPESKTKACLVNDSIIVYLSDLNRGVGFTTLRKIQLNTRK